MASINTIVKKESSIFTLVLPLLVLLATFFILPTLTNTPPQVGMLLGLAILLIFFYRGLKGLAIASIIAIILFFIIGHHTQVEDKKHKKQIFSTFVEMSEKETPLSNEQITKMNLRDSDAKTIKYLNEEKAKIYNVMSKYEVFFEEKIGKALDLNILASKRMRKAYTKNIVETNKKHNESKKELNTILDDMKSYFKLWLPERYRTEYEENNKYVWDYWHNFFELQSEFLNTLLRLYSFLDTQEGEFSVDGDQLVFNTDEAVNKYNHLVQSLENISKRMDVLINKTEDTKNLRFQKLKNDFKIDE